MEGYLSDGSSFKLVECRQINLTESDPDKVCTNLCAKCYLNKPTTRKEFL